MTRGETRRFNEVLLTIKNLESTVKHLYNLIADRNQIIKTLHAQLVDQET